METAEQEDKILALQEDIGHLTTPDRKPTFQRVARLCIEHGVKRMLEIGSYRGIQSNGNSTLVLAKIAQACGALMMSVDCSRFATKTAAKSVEGFANVQCITDNSLDFIGKLPHSYKFGFVYFDGLDFPQKDEESQLPVQLHCVAEVGAMQSRWADKAIALIDDCGVIRGGKGGMAQHLFKWMKWKRDPVQKYQWIFTKGI